MNLERIHLPSIDSTNAYALREAARGAKSPMLISADTQTAGRGRSGRAWQSPMGGAWFSLLWPTHQAGERYVALPMLIGLVVWEVLAEGTKARRHQGTERAEGSGQAIRNLVSGPRPMPQALSIKWPNDILLDGRKVCGILCEAHASQSGITHVVAGVGINVDFEATELQGELRHTPTTLRDAMRWREAESSSAALAIIDAFADRVVDAMLRFERDGLSPAQIETINANLAYKDQPITWQFNDEYRPGIVRGIDAMGRLLFEADGQVSAIDSGELTTLKPNGRGCGGNAPAE